MFWTPGLLDDFRKEVGRFAEGIFDEATSSTVFAPSVNFAETETGYEVSVELPGLNPEDVSVEFKDGHPVDRTRYNTATEFLVSAKFADGKEIEIRHDGNNGILFEGTKGRIFVNRGRITGKPVEALASNPLPDGALEEAYKNRPLTDHFRGHAPALHRPTSGCARVFAQRRRGDLLASQHTRRGDAVSDKR